MRNVTECQQKLIALGYLSALDDTGNSNADGKFGERSLDAYNHYLAALGRPPVNNVTMADLNATLFPDEQPAAPVKSPSIFDQLGTILSVLNLLKGKSMTSDQITGIVRLLLGLAAGYFTAKGIGSADLWNWITAGALTAIPALWSWYSNRPKTILSIADKKALNQ